METPIKYSDLIRPDDSIEKAIQQLEELQKQYAAMAAEIKKQSSEIANGLKNVNGATEQGREKIETAAKETDKLAAAQKQLAFAQSETGKELLKLRAQISDVNAATKKQIALNNAAEGSYNQLSAQYAINKQRLNAMSAAEREAAEQSEKLVTKTREIYEKMKELQKETGQAQLNVGNYASGLEGLEDKLKNAVGLNGKFGDSLLALGRGGVEGRSAFTAMADGAKAFGKSLLGLMTNPAFLAIAGVAGVAAGFKWWWDYNDGLIQATRLTKEFTGKSGNDLKAFRNEVSAVADVYSKEFKDVLTAADSLTANFGLTFDESIKVIKDGFAAGVDDGGDFLAGLKQFPAAFKEMGVSAEEYVTILQQTNSGIFGTDGMAAMEKAAQTLRTMSSSTAESLRAIGINANQLSKDLTSGDKSVFVAIQEISAKIATLPDNSKAAANAIQNVFGEIGVKAGQDMIESFATLNTNFQELQKSAGAYNEQQQAIIESQIELNNATSALLDNTDGLFEQLKTDLTVLTNKVLTALINGVIDLYNWFAELYNESVLVRGAIQAWLTPIQITFDVVKNALVGVWNLVKGIAQTLKGVFTLDWDSISEGFSTAALSLPKAFKGAATDIVDTVKGTFDNIQNTKLKPIEVPVKVQSEGGDKKTTTGGGTEPGGGLSAKEIEDLYKKRLEAQRKYEDAVLALQADGFDKQRKQIELHYNRQIEDLQHLIKTDKQNRETYNLQIILAENNKNKELEKLETEHEIKFLEMQKNALSEQLFLVQKGSEEEYKLKLQSLEYDKKIALLKNQLLPSDSRQTEMAIETHFEFQAGQISDEYQNELLRCFDLQQSFNESEFELLKSTETQKTVFRLNAEKERLQKILELNKTAQNKMSDVEVKTIENKIKKIDADIEQAETGQPFWEKIGINIPEEGKEAISESYDFAMEQLNNFMEKRTEAASQRVADSEREVAAAQAAFDNEVKLAQMGYANNVQEAQRDLALAKEQQKKALDEQRKAQKQQAQIQSLQQAADLITATAKIWGQLGFPWAIPAIATMWTSFAVSKIKAKNETREQYGEGTVELLEGGSHASGNDIDLGTKKDGTKRRAEGGEFFAVINKRNSRKYRSVIPSVIHSLNSGNFEQKFLNSESQNFEIVSRETKFTTLENDVSELKTMLKNRVDRYTDTDGNLVEVRGANKRIIKR